MLGHASDPHQSQFLYTGLKEMLNPRQPIFQLAERIPWREFEEAFADKYSSLGRPSKPIRLMVSLLILKQLHNLSDESVVEQWMQNPYWQYFSGESVFQWKKPVEPSDLTHFRKRIGEQGVEKIFQVSVLMHGEASREQDVIVDTTVQEKNITFPTDTKLQRKIIDKCRQIAWQEALVLRQSYVRLEKRLLVQMRFGRNAKNRRKARAAARKIRTIAGRLVRDVERKLPADRLLQYEEDLALFKRVLSQKRSDKDKVYSLHEPDVKCIAKGKEHKKYEFGSKVSIALTKGSGIIVGAKHFKENLYDGHTLPEALTQVEQITGSRPKRALVDRGYRGRKQIEQTVVELPESGKKRQSEYQRRNKRKRMRRRAAIEPVIGHLKHDHRMVRNYLKGSLGDAINLLMAAAAFNFKKWLRQAGRFFVRLRSAFGQPATWQQRLMVMCGACLAWLHLGIGDSCQSRSRDFKAVMTS